MGQINVNPNDTQPTRDEGAGTAATRNLTWAIAMVIVIAAIAIAVVYVAHGLMHVF